MGAMETPRRRDLLLAALVPGFSTRLEPESLAAFQKYMETADRAMEARARSAAPRLHVAAGATPAIEAWDKQNPREVPNALIHDWIGAAQLSGARVAGAVAVLQDIEHYPSIYSGDILLARSLEQHDGHRRVLFRVIKKKVITVVLETEYDVTYRRISDTRTQVWSRSTRIAEVSDYGKAEERVLPPDTGYGFLWRLNTYWHLEERDGGLLMECRAISLTRDIPAGLGWIVKPMVTSLPREALQGTLDKTRAAVAQRRAAR